MQLNTFMTLKNTSYKCGLYRLRKKLTVLKGHGFSRAVNCSKYVGL